MSTDTDDPRQRLRPEAAQKLAGFEYENTGDCTETPKALWP